MTSLNDYRYRGARASILLHERSLREFLVTWRRFKATGQKLADTEDPNYASPELLLRHVLRAAKGYMDWICEQLGLPDPGIDDVPEEEAIEAEAGAYVENLIERWQWPLAEIPEYSFHDRTYRSRWNVEYCIDAMLEHAVLHPMRHAFQLREILESEDDLARDRC